MAICLIKEYKDKFLAAIKSGDINPNKLMSMSTAEREAYLARFVGEFNAKYVNTEFESKLLLKNQQRGMITWAQKISGISKTSRADILDKINKLDKALTPETEKQFLGDIVERRLGVSVTLDESKEISRLSNVVASLRDPNLSEDWQQSRQFHEAKQGLLQYMRSITPESVPKNMYQLVKKRAADVLSVARALKVGFNFHAPFRQGRALFGTKAWNTAFVNMFKYAVDKSAFDGLEVEMMMSKHADILLKYKNDLGLTQLGATFTSREEDFGAKILDKIPLMRGSERGYVGFLNDLRFRRFTGILDNLEKSGNGIADDPEALKALAQVIGDSTGRGNLGGFEGAARSLSTVLFSPRFFASRVKMLIDPISRSGPARREAAQSLARLAGTSVAVLGAMKLAGFSVETDPRSTNFGTVKVGHTSFDMTGGMKTYIVAMSQIYEKSTKSSVTGQITQLNTGKFGSRTTFDVLTSLITNKTSPVASVIKDFMVGQSIDNQPLDINKILSDPSMIKYITDQVFNPLSSEEAMQAYNQGAGETSLSLGSAAFLGSFFGVTSQTINPKPPKVKSDSRTGSGSRSTKKTTR